MRKRITTSVAESVRGVTRAEHITFIGGMMLRYIAQVTGHCVYSKKQWQSFLSEPDAPC
jgi:hypothetical protein